MKKYINANTGKKLNQTICRYFAISGIKTFTLFVIFSFFNFVATAQSQSYLGCPDCFAGLKPDDCNAILFKNQIGVLNTVQGVLIRTSYGTSPTIEIERCDGNKGIGINFCIENQENSTFKIRLHLVIPNDFEKGDFIVTSSNPNFSFGLNPQSLTGEFVSDEITLEPNSLNSYFLRLKYVGLTDSPFNFDGNFDCNVSESTQGVGQSLFKKIPMIIERNRFEVGSETSFPDLSSALNGGMIVSTDPVNVNFLVKGTFTINGDFILTRSNIYMNPDAEIKIINGATLTLIDTEVSRCDDLPKWSRINVINGAIVTKSTLVKKRFGGIRETIIKEGHSLVEIQDNGFGSFADTRFMKFDKAITVNNTGGIGAFYGNLLIPEQASFAGVELNNTAVALNGGLVISGSGGVGTIQTGVNRFIGIDFGIRSINSVLRASNNKFTDIANTGVYSNAEGLGVISLVKNTFENCRTGMRGINSNLAFSYNTIHGSERGIYLSGVNTNVAITNNEEMQVNTVGILYDRLRTGSSFIFHNGIDANIRGIHSFHSSGGSMTIDDNNITAGAEGAFIKDLASPLALWNVRKNTFYHGAKGIHFIAGGGNTVNENKMFGNAMGALVEGGTAYSLTENEMQGCNSAMQVSASNSPNVGCNYSNLSSIGFNFNGNCSQVDFSTNLMKGGVGLGVGIDGMINKMQPFKGNLWFNSTANNTAQSYQGFQFTVNESFNPRHMPTTRNPTPWFFDSPNGTGEDCATFMAEIPKKVGATWAVVNGTYSNPRRAAAGLWIAKAQAYQYLKENPEEASDDLSQEFLAAEAQSSVGKLYAVKQAMNAARTTMLGHINAMEAVSQQISTKMDELEIIDGNLAEAPSSAELRKQHVDKVLEIKAKEGIIATETVELQEDWTVNLNLALSLNAAVVATEEYELNEKNVNAIWLNTMARDLTPSNDELDVLRSVANQCPYSGGEAVYVARGLYQSYVEDATFDDESLCAMDQGRIQKEEVKGNAALTVYPNPATDILQILTANNVENATFEVLNTLGQVVYQGVSNTIDISNFQVGLYVCNLLDKGKVVASSKFAIQH